MLRVQSNTPGGAFHKNIPRFKTNGIFVKSPTSDNWLGFWAQKNTKFLVEDFPLSFKGYFKKLVIVYKVYIFFFKLSYTNVQVTDS